MTYKTGEDIWKEKEEEEREEMKQKAVAEVKGFMREIFPKKDKKKFSVFKCVGILLLLLFLTTLIAGFVWLLKFFIGGIF